MTHGAPGRTSCTSAMPGERLDRLLHERGGHRHRRHRAHQQERRHDHGLAGARVGDDPLEHAHVEAQRRVDVAVREQHRLGRDRIGAAEDDLGEAQAVGRRHARGCLARPHAVGHANRRERAHEMAHVEGDVVGLEHAAPGRVDRRRSAARAAADPRDRRACRRAAPAPRRTNGGPWTGPKIIASPPISSDRCGLRARSENVRRRERRLRAQEPRVEANRVAVDGLARRAEERERLRVVELHPDLGREPVDAAVDDCERLLGQGLEPWQPVHEHAASPRKSAACGRLRRVLPIELQPTGEAT